MSRLAELAMLAIPVSFPDHFLWGVSTSSHQFEGGNTLNQWHDWERAGHIRSGTVSGEACDWWRNAERDLDLCSELGLNAIRISLEWSRMEPAYAHWSEMRMALSPSSEQRSRSR